MKKIIFFMIIAFIFSINAQMVAKSATQIDFCDPKQLGGVPEEN